MYVDSTIHKPSPQSFSKLKATTEKVRSSTSPNKKLIKCPECPATFSKYTYRKYHLRGHQAGYGTFSCHLCTFGTKRGFDLSKHMKLHTLGATADPMSEDPYQCPKCPASFKIRQRYQNHWKNHGAQSTHTCPSCDFSVFRIVSHYFLIHNSFAIFLVFIRSFFFQCLYLIKLKLEIISILFRIICRSIFQFMDSAEMQ